LAQTEGSRLATPSSDSVFLYHITTSHKTRYARSLSQHCKTTSFCQLSTRDVHGIGNPNGNESPMVIPWEWDKN